MRLSFILLVSLLVTGMLSGQTSSPTSNSLTASDLQGARLSQASSGFSYTFNYTQSSYIPLTSSEDLTQGLVWDKPDVAIPLGFTLRYFDGNTDSLFLGNFFEKRVLGLRSDKRTVGPLMVLFAGELIDRAMEDAIQPGQTGGVSPILKKTIGLPGNRITIVEFRNFGFKKDIDHDQISTDFVSFQLLIKERTSDIEFLMGPSSISEPEDYFNGRKGSSLGLIPEFDFEDERIINQAAWFEGYPHVPSVVIADSLVSFAGSIPEGYGFQFIREDLSTSTELPENQSFSAYPNPTRNVITVKLEGQENASLSLLNMQGKTLRRVAIQSELSLDLSAFPAGTYLLKLEKDGSKPVYRKLMRL